MKLYSTLVLTLVLVVVLALGVVQGRRMNHLRESEMFYRWILSEATRSRIFDEELSDARGKKMMDAELFESIASAVEGQLGDVPMGESDVDSEGKPLGKFLVFAESEGNDKAIWDLASSKLLNQQRQDFLRYLREKRLYSVASEFDTEAVYGGEGIGVSLGNIVLGFRKLAANFLWIQVDKYWHQGAIHRMIPLMHTSVTLDPNFVDAYQIGAWHLAYNATAHLMDTPEPLKKFYPKYGKRLGEKELYYYMAIDFLKDGIRKNPRDYRLYFDLGFAIYNLKLQDYANAVKYLEEAIRYRHDRWVPRQLYINYELNGQYDRALAGWRDYLEKNRDKPIEVEKAHRFIARNLGQLKEEEAQGLFAKAKEASGAEAEQFKAAAEKSWEEARQIWESMVGPGGELDPFAEGRLLRMKALRMLDEERYLEAIAVLENARLVSNQIFFEASEMIIDAKIAAGLPLSVSEKKAVLRREEAEKYENMPPPAEDGNASS